MRRVVWHAMAAHQQPLRVHAVRRAGDERDEVLARLDAEFLRLVGFDHADSIDLVGERAVEHGDVEVVAFPHLVKVGEQA